MVITPDLKQNIFYTVYFTVSHNVSAFFYLSGIIVSLILALIKPTRKSIFLLLGFIILLFSFEYNKHIVVGLREQTLNALITIQEHNKVRRIINFITLKALPILLPLGGWGFVALAGFLHLKKTGNKTIIEKQ